MGHQLASENLAEQFFFPLGLYKENMRFTKQDKKGKSGLHETWVLTTQFAHTRVIKLLWSNSTARTLLSLQASATAVTTSPASSRLTLDVAWPACNACSSVRTSSDIPSPRTSSTRRSRQAAAALPLLSLPAIELNAPGSASREQHQRSKSTYAWMLQQSTPQQSCTKATTGCSKATCQATWQHRRRIGDRPLAGASPAARSRAGESCRTAAGST